MAEEKVLNWGICGAGKISNDFCSAMMTLSRYEREHKITAIAARSQEKAQKFADIFEAPKAYGSYKDVANDPDIEIVYIGVIHTEHVRLSMMMLEAGKHVVCEKPLAPTWQECKKVLDYAKEKKLLFLEAVWSRFFPVYDAIKDEVNSGNLGDISMVTTQFCIPIMSVERLCRKDLMGGVLLDIGIYCIQFACHVYGEMPEKIIATGSLNEEGVDEDGCVILLYSGNRKASLVYSGKTASGNNTATIMGSKGQIFIDDCFWCPKSVKLTDTTLENKIPEGPSPYNFYNSGGLRYEADHAFKLIRSGQLDSPKYGYKDVEMIHKIIDEISKQIGLKY
ncbi:dihydrodiol dehydrogenase / D-xylose 1-dehydrogenase (NADP) [Mytilus galloprovincialis]|uniref:Trans-1,2-dihydrobenzene-1,2-diol dehydrogenase n=1 Tax=Mytilus galloprovincialis TaxID=29158 RepID=A0A8B6GTY8_MYTGA|nr:dihydrodiol dehydrogenase / D-xylose 1-dehydrogenase (NADP) [Mytilus galloprovincialis]